MEKIEKFKVKFIKLNLKDGNLDILKTMKKQ